MTRYRGRIIATVVVAAAVTLAYAAAGTGSITVTPRIEVVRHAAGMGGSSAVTVTNTGTTAVTVGSITYDCGTPPAMRLLGGSGASPFTLGPGASRPVVIECPAGLGVGMQRCAFTVRDTDQLPILDFLGACETTGMQQLAITPASHDFGTVTIGQDSVAKTVFVTNASATTVTTLQLQLDDDNFLIGSPCQDQLGCDATSGVLAGSSAAVDVICKPTTVGPHTGQLFAIGSNGFFTTTPLQLACTGAAGVGPVLTLTPGSIDLTTPVEVNDPASAPATIQLANSGGDTLTVSGVSVTDDGVTGARLDWTFTLDGQCTDLPCPLAAGQILNVRFTFDPSNFNARPAKLIVNYSDPAIKQQSADLDGIGRGATLELASTGSTIDFGTLPLNTAGTQTFALQNRGNRATIAMLSASPLAPFTFPATVAVAPSAVPIVTVTCQSATATTVTRTLTVGAGSDVTTLPLELTLKCDVRDTLIQASPASHAFGEVRLGTPVAKTFRISRVGSGAPIAFTAALADATNPNLVLGAPTAAQTPADVTLTVDPMTLGAFAAAIVITPVAMPPISIPISGSVVSVEFSTPPLVSLGTFCVGQPTTPTAITLVSTGTGKLRMAEAPALVSNPSPFTLELVSPPGYPALLDPMSEATVIVTPPRGTLAGVQNESVRWTTDVGDRSTTIAATYVDDGGAIAPDSLVFGEVPIRVGVDNAQQITLQNCSAQTLELDPVMAPEPFVLDDQFPTSLEPGKKATFSVAFQPTQVGHFEKALVVTTRAGDTYVVALIGDGISDGGPADDDGTDLGSTSFYACSGCASHDPSGVLAIALAGVCAVTPRRRRRR